MARDYGKKCSGPAAVKRMADGGYVTANTPDKEWWGQGSDGGASPVAGVRTAAASVPTARLSAPAAPSAPSAPIPAVERADLSGSMGAMTPRADVPSMPKPKALPRPKQKAAVGGSSQVKAPTAVQATIRKIDNPAADAARSQEWRNNRARGVQPPMRDGREILKSLFRPSAPYDDLHGNGWADGGKIGGKVKK